MGHGMGDRRKEGSRGSASRRDARSGPARRGAVGAATRHSSTGNAAWTTGHRRLRMVAMAFAVLGLLLGGRAVQMIVADDERYQAFAAEQGTAWPAPAAGQVRGSIVSADGRELATSLEAARVVATPYQIEDPKATARELHAELGKETDTTEKQIRTSLTRRGADGQLSGYSIVATGVEPKK